MNEIQNIPVSAENRQISPLILFVAIRWLFELYVRLTIAIWSDCILNFVSKEDDLILTILSK